MRGNYTGFGIPTPEEIEEKAAAEKDPAKKKALAEKPRREEKFTRLDPVVSFHFGQQAPNPEKMIAEEFRAGWNGSVITQETGLYEFVVKSENGVRLWVNDPQDPLIDAWVATTPEVREEKKSILLLGGRSYRIKIEMLKYKDKSASLELWWKPPHGVLECVPESNLTPQEVRPNMVVTTSIPADDRSDGYERGTTVSKEWDEATTAGAMEVADHVDKDLDALTGSKPNSPDRVEKLKNFCVRFLETAFGRQIPPEVAAFVNKTFEKAPSPAHAVRQVVLFTLKSPRFLYPELSRGEKPDDFTAAARLASVLWDSIPDAALWKAASEGRLHTKEQLEKEARRMLGDRRAKAKLNGFFQTWLDLERAEHASKDAKEFPQFDEALRADLRQSLMLFLDEVVWGERSDYRELLQANHLWLNQRLGKFFGQEINGNGFERVVPAVGERSGVLTHPYLLSALAYNRTTSPIHRGVFLSRSIVGVHLKNPSIAVAFEDAKFDPSLTMREKVSSLTKNASCAGCHGVINPLGFALENFDAVGRFRTVDNQKPVDAVVDFDTEEGSRVRFSGARDVAQHAIQSGFAHEAFVRQLFHYSVKQPPGAFGQETLKNITTQFKGNNFNVRNLLAQIALTKASADLPKEQPQVAANATSPNTPQ